MSLVSVQLRIKYRNTNGDFDFDGAEYRFVDSKKTQVLASGKTNAKGLTKALKLPENTIIYVQLKNAYTGEWESPDPYQHVYLEAKKSIPIYHTTVLNCYFQAKLVGNNYITFNPPWGYRVIFKGEQDKSIEVSGTLDKNGLTPMFDAQKILLKQTTMQQQAKDRFNELARSKHPMVEVIFIEPKTGKEIKEYARVIPVGSDKKYREFKIKLTQAQTQHYTQQSMTKLENLKRSRPMTLDITLQGGTTYTVEREDKGKFFNHEIEETNKVSFKDGIPLTVYIPLGYCGKVFVKKGDKIIGTFPIEALDPNKTNQEIKLILNNKSMTKHKNTLRLEDINKTTPTIWGFQCPSDIPQGEYQFEENKKSSNESVFKQISLTILQHFAFDTIVAPLLSDSVNILTNENHRNLVFEALKKYRIGTDKYGRLKFYVKKSKTGKNLIIFKGYAGLRSFITLSNYMKDMKNPADYMKVSMLATAVDLRYAENTVNGGKIVADVAKGSVKSWGFALVAGFEVTEWILTDGEDISNLTVALISAATKTAIAAMLGVGAMAGAIFVAGVFSSTLPVIAVVAIGTGTVILASMGLEWVDRKLDLTGFFKDRANWLGEKTGADKLKQVLRDDLHRYNERNSDPLSVSGD